MNLESGAAMFTTGGSEANALQRAIARDRSQGLTPFLVIATLGTTGTGAIDPLADIARISRAERL